MSNREFVNDVAADVAERLREMVAAFAADETFIYMAALQGAARGVQFHDTTKKSGKVRYCTKAAENEAINQLAEQLRLACFGRHRTAEAAEQ